MSRAAGGAANHTQASPSADVFHGQIDPTRAHQDVLRGLDGKQVCPFCGSVSEKSPAPCARCGMDNTPDARKATKQRIGPWYVLQARNPAAPGMRFETLLSFVRKGRVRARSIVRGPTTHQLWRFAAHVKGLSREFGLCFSCGSAIEPSANVCPQCNRLQEPPVNPDVLLEDGSEDQVRTVYRELPQPAAAAAAPAVHEPEPEDADIVIPAFGGFAHEESVQPPIQPSAPPVVAPPPPPQPSSQMSVTMSYPPSPSPAPRPAPVPRPAAAQSNENPFAIAPPRKKGNGGGAGGEPAAGAFLSAKELAAAFKLSFDPSADMDSVDIPDQVPASAMPEGMRPGAMVPRNPMGTALAGNAAAGGPPRRKRRGAFGKFVLFVLILAGTALALLMWVDPAFRARTIEWSKTTWTRIHDYATGKDDKNASPMPSTTNPADDFEIRDPAPIATTSPAAIPDDPVIQADAAPDEPSEVAVEPAPAPTTKPAAPRPQPQPNTTARKNASPPPSPRPATPKQAPPAPPAAQDNFARMDQLRDQAFAARRRGDYAAEVEFWEEIQKLPAEDWPKDLKLRLDRARQAAAEKQ